MSDQWKVGFSAHASASAEGVYSLTGSGTTSVTVVGGATFALAAAYKFLAYLSDSSNDLEFGRSSTTAGCETIVSFVIFSAV
jgi:hypothetical protein